MHVMSRHTADERCPVYTASTPDKSHCTLVQRTWDGVLHGCKSSVAQVRLQKSALFHPTQAISCLSLLHVRGLPEGPPGQNRLHALHTMVDLTGTEQVCLNL